MAKKITLKAKPRKILGRKVKKLRSEGWLPANVYGKGIDSKSLKLKTDEFVPVYQQAGESAIVYLKVSSESKQRPVLIHQVAKDPVYSSWLHVDFRQVDLTQAVEVSVPLKLVGEAPAVEEQGGILVTVKDEVLVEALPTKIPDEIEIDVTGLTKIGDSLSISEAVKVDAKQVKILDDPDETLVMIDSPEPEEEEESVEPAEVEPGEEGEVKPVEEGEDKPAKEDDDSSEKEAASPDKK